MDGCLNNINKFGTRRRGNHHYKCLCTSCINAYAPHVRLHKNVKN